MVPLPLFASLANPWGLLGLLAVIPLILLYFLRPDPRRYALPTIEFLFEESGGSGSDNIFERLKRSLLLLIQLLVLLSIPLALAGPHLALPGTAAAGHTVLVVDNSASMATEADGESRLDAAIERAATELGETTTIVSTAPEPDVHVVNGSRAQAESALADLSVVHSEGDLNSALRTARTTADQPARIVVLSDFVDGSDWRSGVERARLANHDVELRQIDDGGEDNVGIIDLEFGSNEVTVLVENFAETEQTRTIELDDEERELTLGPGDIAEETFPLPESNTEVRLTPRDSFPLDDVVYISTPERPTVEVLVITNDENTYLTTALDVHGSISYTVAEPPVTSVAGYDVIIFSNVDGDRLLRGTVQDASAHATDGGGVIVQSQADLESLNLGDLALIDPDHVAGGTEISVVQSHPIVSGFDLVRTEEHLTGELRHGEVLAETDAGNPFMAVGEIGAGNVIYYGYFDDAADFKYTHRYPVFWREAVYYAADRVRMGELNYQTGETVDVAAEATVETPTGTQDGPQISLDRIGYYDLSDRVIAANLLTPAESAVVPNPISVDRADGPTAEIDRPVDMTPLLVILAVMLAILEVGYLRYRGDL